MSALKEKMLNIIPKKILDFHFEKKAKQEYKKWQLENNPIPPPHAVKKYAIREYQKKSGFKTLIETGTYKGSMVFAQLNYFDAIYSIELAESLYLKAKKRFRKYKKVHLYQGDSSIELGKIIKDLSAPAIFWLDGHYSGGETAKGETECPIWAELEHILASNFPHIILIDDARCFNGENDYPAINELKKYFQEKENSASFEVLNDIIRIVLKK